MSKEDSNAQDARQAELNTKYYAAAAGVGEKKRRGQPASPPPRALPSSGSAMEKLVDGLGTIRLRELRVADAGHVQQQQQVKLLFVK